MPEPVRGLGSLFDPRRSSQSGSLRNAEYWWYGARQRILQSSVAHAVPSGARILEVGSADGPSVGWLSELGDRIPTDLDPRGLSPGGVCASATRLPFQTHAFDVVAAFDVIEHIADERAALSEIHRVLCPSGVLLASVPAYHWAWSSADVFAGHQRRYTRPRLRAALERNGFVVERLTHAFAGTFPFFALDRLRARISGRDPERVSTSSMPDWQQGMLRGFSRLDERVLTRTDLPFGSSIVAIGRRVP